MIKKTFGERVVLIFRDMGEISTFVLQKWAEIAEWAINRKKDFTVALSGGRTPVQVHRDLALQKNLPWGKTHVLMVDERFVPYDRDENNFRMISESLLRHVDIPARNIHPIITSDQSASDCADKYENHLASFFKLSPGIIPNIDLILLGIGEDGHTASLFPGTASLSETSRLAVAVIPPDTAGTERISLTFPVINNASNVLFLATGESKAGVLREVIMKENGSLPAAMVMPHNSPPVFLVDNDAGALLTGGKR